MHASPISSVSPLTSVLPKILNQLQTPPTSFLSQTPQNGSFLELVAHIGKSTRDSLVRSEKLSKAAALGDADPQEVAIEVMKAKAALHQLTVLVNTSLQSCQELLKMGV